MLETQKNIVRARCADIGTLLRVLFWITVALVAVRLVYGTWLLFQPAEMLVEHFSLGVSCGVSFWWSTLFWIVIAGVLRLGCAISGESTGRGRRSCRAMSVQCAASACL